MIEALTVINTVAIIAYFFAVNLNIQTGQKKKII